MIKKVLFMASMLMPGLAYGGNPSADLSVQVAAPVPNGTNQLLGLTTGDGTNPAFHVWAGRYPDFVNNYAYCHGDNCDNRIQTLGNWGANIIGPTMFSVSHLGGSITDPHSAAIGSYNSTYDSIISSTLVPIASRIYVIRVDWEWPLAGDFYNPFGGFASDPNQTNPLISPADFTAGACNLIARLKANSATSGIPIEFDAPLTTKDQAYWPTQCESSIALTGGDPYFSPADNATSAGNWTARSTGSNCGPYCPSIAASYNWSVLKNKPQFFGEWADCYTDGYVMAQFAAWMKTNNTVGQVYWDRDEGTPGGLPCSIGQNSTRMQAYINAFGSTHYTGSYFTLKPVPSTSGY